MRSFGLAAFLVMVALVPDSACSQDQFDVGVAKVDITPHYPIRLNGFGFRRDESEGVTQRIWAKAMAVSQANEPPIVLLAIDSLGVRMEMLDEVAADLKKRHGVARQRVALTYSHSHTTPKVNGAADNIFSQPIPAAHQVHIDRYTHELTDQLKRVASLAIAAMRPSRLEWAVGRVDLAKNRRTPGGPVDHDLPVMVVRDLNGNPKAIYASYACHCVTLSHNKIGGDWAGYVQTKTEASFPGCLCLFSIGAGSDSNPSSGVVGDRVEVAEAQGKQLCDEITRVVSGQLEPLMGPLGAEFACVDLPLNDLPSREELQSLAQRGGPAGFNAQTQLGRLERGESLQGAVTYPIQSFRFGERLTMVFLAGEVCVDYSLRLKKELGESVWINAYSNDFGCYIPSERLVKEGGYGGGAEIPYFALPATLKSGLEDRICHEVMRQVQHASF